MGRKKYTVSTMTPPGDTKYGSSILAKFINVMMYDGKKHAATRMMYDALDIVAEKNKELPVIEIFEKALENVKPMIEVRSKRVGGATYQVPMPVSSKRRFSLAMRWLRDTIRTRNGRSSAQRAAEEILNAFKGEGEAMRKREMVHRMAEANKAFAHFAR